MSDLRQLPSVDELLRSPQGLALQASYGRPLTLEALRNTLTEARNAGQPIPTFENILNQAGSLAAKWSTPTLIGLINATGVIVHTNLGRAPLSAAAIQAMQAVAQGYSNLEYDVERGKRGSRTLHAEELLRRLTGAEAALVVNNNAAAVLLILTALARRKRVIIARSQLIEIGGGFRIPDVMRQSGAKLHEVGTTNRVHLHDYEEALQEPAGLVMRAHRSNFQISGFTSEPEMNEIAAAAHAAGVPLVDDLGSGTLLDTAPYGMQHEPTVNESLAAGSDVVCFSGDKLLGGPQAGIIVGKAHLLAKIKKHPLARAVRADKLCLAALNATLLHYLNDQALTHIPVWQMISARPDVLQQRAQAWADALGQGSVIASQSTVGGGSLPGETLPTFVLAIPAANPNRLLDRLRRHAPPVIGRVENGLAVFDPRTVLPGQEPALLAALQAVL